MVERLIAVASSDPGALAVCKRALATFGRVIDWDHATAGKEAPDVDLLVFDIGDALIEGTTRYAEVRRKYSTLPVLLLARGVTTEIAVELIRLGAQDLLASGPDDDVLAAKVRRLFDERRVPVFDHPVFAPFEPPSTTPAEQRRAFRAPVPENLAARIRLRLRPREVEASVLDISLETDGVPGSMLVRFPGDSVDPEVFRREELVASSAASVTLPEGRGPVELSVLPVRVQPAPNGRSVDVVFQYRPLDPNDAARIARFWMQCQARARK